MEAHQHDLPSASELESLSALERQLKSQLPGPIVRSMNGFRDSDIYLATSWLQAIHTTVRRQHGDTAHENKLLQADQRQLLVAIANRLDLDVEALLEADPETEVRMVYEALRMFQTG